MLKGYWRTATISNKKGDYAINKTTKHVLIVVFRNYNTVLTKVISVKIQNNAFKNITSIGSDTYMYI